MAYGGKSAQEDGFVVQMRDMRTVSRNIAELYTKGAPHIAQAATYSYLVGEEARRNENQARRNAIFYFKDLVLITATLPEVLDERVIKKHLAEPMFNDAIDLLAKLDTADQKELKSPTLQKMWLQYAKLLVKADLINAYKMSEQKSIWT